MAIGNDNVSTAADAAAAATASPDPLLKGSISLFRLGANLVVSLSVDVALLPSTTLSTALNIVAVKLINVDAPVVVNND